MGHLRVVGHALQPISSPDSRAVDPRPAQGTVVSWRCRNYCGSFALWCFSAQVFSVCYIESFGDCIARDTKMLPGNVQRYQVWETRNLSQVRWNPRNLCRLNLTCLVSVSNLLKNSRGEACWSELMTCTFVMWNKQPTLKQRILRAIKCTVSVKCKNIAFTAMKEVQAEFHCWCELLFW